MPNEHPNKPKQIARIVLVRRPAPPPPPPTSDAYVIAVARAHMERRR